MAKNFGEQAREEDEIDFDPQSVESTKEFKITKLESSREAATDLQREVASGQAMSLEDTSLTLMRRSAEGEKNNVELVNALAGFLQALEHQASFGSSSEPLRGAKDLTNFLQEAAKALRWKVGPESVSGVGVEEPDFSKWESKKKK